MGQAQQQQAADSRPDTIVDVAKTAVGDVRQSAALARYRAAVAASRTVSADLIEELAGVLVPALKSVLKLPL